MLSDIDFFLLNKDISCWYESIDDAYEQYFNPVFEIKIILEFIEEDFLVSVHKGNEIIVAVYDFQAYSQRTDKEILDHILKMVLEIINDKC